MRFLHWIYVRTVYSQQIDPWTVLDVIKCDAITQEKVSEKGVK